MEQSQDLTPPYIFLRGSLKEIMYMGNVHTFQVLHVVIDPHFEKGFDQRGWIYIWAFWAAAQGPVVIKASIEDNGQIAN